MREFQEQAQVSDSDADDLFTKKPSKKSQKKDNSSDSDSSESEEKQKPDEKKPKEMRLVTDTELLARFYAKDDTLDESEKFLRNYILNEGWKSGAKAIPYEQPKPTLPEGEHVDEEDLNRENEMDIYEKQYNFRFEEGNAGTITSHARDVGKDETVRRQDDTRKLARERAKERKDELKKQRQEELARLKQLKKEEIMEKLEKANKLAKGSLFEDKNLVEKVQKELESDFIADMYDKTMAKMYGEKYYEDDNDSDEFEIEQNKDIDLQLLADGHEEKALDE